MNKIYRLVWNEARQALVAVSELAMTKCKGASSVVGTVAALTCAVGAQPALALDPGALPTGGQITAGQGTISQSGAKMTINQASQQMIANWQSFNIGQNAGVQFVQPGAASTALNRISDQKPSQIFGSLTANGHVFLLNPSGILFGASAQVDVGGLVASSLDMADADFLSRTYRFSNPGQAGAVINQGHIRTGDYGVVALIGPQVTNEGSIETPKGGVALAAGDRVSLDFSGDGLIDVSVDAAALDASAANKGLIKADGGTVAMTAKTANNLLSTVVNNQGVIEADSISEKNGVVVLDGGDQGVTANTGAISAQGRNPGEKGGSVTVTGDKVALESGSRIDASGMAGGGQVYIGGGWQGKDPAIHDARAVAVAPTASVKADGGGGEVALWSNDFTNFAGTISARGGRVETSSQGVLRAVGAVVADAWLLDPTAISIASAASQYGAFDGGASPNTFTPSAGVYASSVADVTTINSSLNAGTSVVVQTTNASGTGSGDITLNADIAKTSGADASLTLKADGSIVIANHNITSTTGALNTVLWADASDAGGAVSIDTANINTNQGALVIGGGSASVTNSITLNGVSTTLTTPKGKTLGTAVLPNGVSINNATLQANYLQIRGQGADASASSAAGAGILLTGTNTISVSGQDNDNTLAMLHGTGGQGDSSHPGGQGILLASGTTTISKGANVAPGLYASGGVGYAVGLRGRGGAGYGLGAVGTDGGAGIEVASGAALNLTAYKNSVGLMGYGGQGGQGDASSGSPGNSGTGGQGGAALLVAGNITASNYTSGGVGVQAYGGAGGLGRGADNNAGIGGSGTGGAGGDGVQVVGPGALTLSAVNSVSIEAFAGNGGKAYGAYGSAGGAATGGAGGTGIAVTGGGTISATASSGDVQLHANAINSSSKISSAADGGAAYGSSLFVTTNGDVQGGAGGDGILVDGTGSGITVSASNNAYLEANVVSQIGTGDIANGGQAQSTYAGNVSGGAGGGGIMVKNSGAISLTGGNQQRLVANYAQGSANTIHIANGGEAETASPGFQASGGNGGGGLYVGSGSNLSIAGGAASIDVNRTGGYGGYVATGGYANSGMMSASGNANPYGTARGGAGGDGIAVAGTMSLGNNSGTPLTGVVTIQANSGSGANGAYGQIAVGGDARAGKSYQNPGPAYGGNGGIGVHILSGGNLGVYSNYVNPSKTSILLAANSATGGYVKIAAGGNAYGGPSTGGSGGSGLVVEGNLHLQTPGYAALNANVAGFYSLIDKTTHSATHATIAHGGKASGNGTGNAQGGVGGRGVDLASGGTLDMTYVGGSNIGAVIRANYANGSNNSVAYGGSADTYSGSGVATAGAGGDGAWLSGTLGLSGGGVGLSGNIAKNGGYVGSGGYAIAKAGAANGGNGGQGIYIGSTGQVTVYAYGSLGGYVGATGGAGGTASSTGASATAGNGGAGINLSSVISGPMFSALNVGSPVGPMRVVAHGGVGATGGDGIVIISSTLNVGSYDDSVSVLAYGGGGGSTNYGGHGLEIDNGFLQLSSNATSSISGIGASLAATGGDGLITGGDGILSLGTSSITVDSSAASSGINPATMVGHGGNGGKGGMGIYVDGGAVSVTANNNDSVVKGYGGAGGYNATAGLAGGAGVKMSSTGSYLSLTVASGHYAELDASGGAGGDFTSAGNAGAGGSGLELDFTTVDLASGVSGAYGRLHAYGGVGGSATSGVGGAGGSGISMVNSSTISLPDAGAANQGGGISVSGGTGGDGSTTGGAGGVGMTVDSSSAMTVVSSTYAVQKMNIVGGVGGSASGSGTGGAGGDALYLGGNLDLNGTAALSIQNGLGGTGVSNGANGHGIYQNGGALTDTATGSQSLSLNLNGGDFLQQGGAGLTANLLAIYSASDVSLMGSGNLITTIAAQVTNSLTLSNQQSLTIGSVGGWGGITAGNSVRIEALGASDDLTIASGAPIMASGSGDALVLAAGHNFINQDGAGALSLPGGGRFLVWSTDPSITGANRGGLAYDFKQYGASYGGTTPSGTGNGFMYSVTPTITVTSLTGTATKVYDATPDATPYLSTSNFTFSGALDGDVVNITPVSAYYDTKNVGTGKTVTTGVSLGATTSSVGDGAKPVYGYNLAAAGPFSGAIGDITAATLNVNYTGVSKVYDTNSSATVTTSDNSYAGDVLTINRTASFVDPNVGSGKTVNVSGVSLGGADAGNYTLASTTGSTTADITPAPLTIDAVSDTKVYDSTSTSLATPTYAGLLGSDGISGLVEAFDSKNVGSRTINVTGYTISDGNGGNNYTVTTNTATGTINPATLNVSYTGVNKAYDQTLNATVTTSDNMYAGDVLTINRTASFVDKNVGTAKTVNVSGVSLSGTDAGNYTLAATTGSTTADITAATLNVNYTGVSKVYDTNSSATVTTSDNSYAGDVLTINRTASFVDPNVGSGKTVNVIGVSLGGADAGNYTLASTTGSTTADITPAPLTIDAVSDTKVYDSTSTSLATPTYVGLLSGDGISGLVEAFDSKNVGSRTINVTGYTISDGNGGNNYQVTTNTATGTINPATLNVSYTGVNKAYDQTLNATVTTSDNMYAGDVLTINRTASFVDKNVGTAKTVNVSGVSLSGLDAGNYTLAATTGSTTADITAATLNVNYTGVSKVYDTNSSATVTTSDNSYAGDVLTINRTASFVDPNVGSGKTVNVIGVSLGGADAGNYTLASTTGSTTADITPAPLTIDAVSDTKVYDSTSTSLATPTYAGLLGSDGISGLVEAFDSKNVGSRTINVTGYTVSDGNGGNNYQVTTNTATGTINPATLNVSYTGVNKAYDQTLNATVTTSDNMYAGDVLTINRTASFVDKNVGTAKTVNVSGVSLSGTDAGNYTLASTTGSTTADITAATLNVNYTGVSKVYDTNSSATVTTSDNSYAGDVLTINRTASFVDPNVGSGKTVNVIGVSLGGADAGNYTLASTTGSTTADITPAPLTIDAVSDTKVYDSTSTSLATPTYAGLLGSDGISGLVEAFDSKNVGSRTINVTGYTVSDGNGGNNYQVTTNTATGTINPATLNVSYTGVNKAYDQTLNATVTTSDNMYAGDVLTINRTASFVDKNVGTAKTVNVSGVSLSGLDAGNYTLAATTGSTTADITAATLNVNYTGVSKVYDTNSSATVTTSDNSYAGDVLTINRTASFVDPNVGSGKTVNVSGVSLGGADAGNYTLASTTGSTTADITPAPLTIDAVSDTKVYDSTSTSLATPTYAGLLGSDGISGLVEAFDSKNVGSRTINVTGYTISDGNGGNNYQVTTNTATGTITPASLTIDAVTDSKTYDGTTSSTATPKVVSGLLGSDSFGNLVELYDSKNAGSRTLSASYTINDGNNGNNYQVTTSTATGTISPRSITVTADKQEKLQGAPDPSLTYTVSWLASGDTLAGALIRSAGETSGDYPILQGTVDDANNPNYLITYKGANLTIDTKNTPVDNAITSANSSTNQQWGYTNYGETGGNENMQPQGPGGSSYLGNFTLANGGLISQFFLHTTQDGGMILEGGGMGGEQPGSVVLPIYTASNGSLSTLAVFKTTVSGNGIAITPNGAGPISAPPVISGPGGPSFTSTITTPDGLTGEIKVSIHAGGVLQVSVPAGFNGLVDERQMMLIGLELARQNLKVNPADLQGVVIDFAHLQAT